MKTNSNTMIFTRDELQYIANGLSISINSYGEDIGAFADIMNLLDRINAELDEFTYQDMENSKEE